MIDKIEKYKRIRQLVKSGLSQAEAGRQVGVSHATVSRWCRDLAKVTSARTKTDRMQTEPAIVLTWEQRRHSEAILRSLAGGKTAQVEDEREDDEERLARYECRGFSITGEKLAHAQQGIGWREMLRATRNARAYLRKELELGLERCAARQAYVRSGRDVQFKPRATNISLLKVA